MGKENVKIMLLVIDVGNTQTALGVYEGERLARMWRVATNREHTADELRCKLSPLLQSEGIDAADIGGAALASVVPQLTGAWVRAVFDFAGIDTVVCSAQTAGSQFETDYPNPREIGADRIADAVAAKRIYGAPVVVVDFGTATNIEVIDEAGAFRGGIIAPGVLTSASALFSHATRLAAIDLADPKRAIGRTTEEALQIGIVYGEADRADGLVSRVLDQLGCTAPVVATGGLAPLIAEHSRTITAVQPDLTLEGLRFVYAECTKTGQ